MIDASSSRRRRRVAADMPPATPPTITTRLALISGQLHEHALDLLEGIAVDLGLLGVGQAVGEAGGHEPEARLLERLGGGGDLRHDVAALATRVEHALDPLDLA